MMLAVNQDMRMLDDASVAPTCSDEILNQDETDTVAAACATATLQRAMRL